MTGRKLTAEDLDRLLRETLPASPAPAEEEERLGALLRGAWIEARAAGAPVARPSFLPAPEMLRAAVGVAAGLVLVLGLMLQLAFPPRLVADGLAVRASAARAVAQLRRAAAMDCVLDVADEAGRPRRYHIAWRAPGETRVRLEDPEGGTWIRAVPPRRIGLLEGATSSSMDDDPRLAPVRDLLSPNRIEGLLDGRGVHATFDATTGLPLRLEEGWAATCKFELPEPAALALAGATGGRP